MAKKGLGKGLDALFLDNTAEVSSAERLEVKLSLIEPNKGQPRKDFDEEAIINLSDSIREHGLLQPILVKPLENGNYRIIAGERRYRACRMAGLDTIPVIIKEISDKEVMELALIENLQRENLNPVEEALGYKELMESYDLTQDEVSKSVNKSRSAVANMLRLLNLPDEIIKMLKDSKLTAGHARAIVAVEDEKRQLEIARLAVKKELSVREVEKLCREQKDKEQIKKPLRDSFYDEVELSLKDELKRKVKVSANKKGQGTVSITFYSKEDLQELMKNF